MTQDSRIEPLVGCKIFPFLPWHLKFSCRKHAVFRILKYNLVRFICDPVSSSLESFHNKFIRRSIFNFWHIFTSARRLCNHRSGFVCVCVYVCMCVCVCVCVCVCPLSYTLISFYFRSTTTAI
jgi:hypothetical protein